MKILFAGGGSGGHFFPIIAIAQELNKIAGEEKIFEMKMFYMAPSPLDPNALYENGLTYVYCSAGKKRRYFSILNFIDLFKTGFGILKAIWSIFNIFPDVIVGKGGYGSFPALVAARIFGIPVIIHESDTAPGRVNAWAGKFARRIAIGFPEAEEYFKKGKTAYTGNPVRSTTAIPITEGAHDYLKLEKNVPTIFILGGSQGSQTINESIMEALPRLVEKYQVIHQIGEKNIQTVKETLDVVLMGNPHRNRYKMFGFMNELEMRMSAGVAKVIISRSGASTIADIGAWGIPSILIPIADSNADHQRKNAFSYARHGGAIVIEEKNLSPNIIISEIDRLVDDPELLKKMSDLAKQTYKKDSARKIAMEIIQIASEHGE